MRRLASIQYLSDARIQELAEIAVELALFDGDRRSLFAQLDDVYGSLPVDDVPIDQLHSDLSRLNRMPPLASGTVPLARWLANAERLRRGQGRADRLLAARAEVQAQSANASAVRHTDVVAADVSDDWLEVDRHDHWSDFDVYQRNSGVVVVHGPYYEGHEAFLKRVRAQLCDGPGALTAQYRYADADPPHHSAPDLLEYLAIATGAPRTATAADIGARLARTGLAQTFVATPEMSVEPRAPEAWGEFLAKHLRAVHDAAGSHRLTVLLPIAWRAELVRQGTLSAFIGRFWGGAAAPEGEPVAPETPKWVERFISGLEKTRADPLQVKAVRQLTPIWKTHLREFARPRLPESELDDFVRQVVEFGDDSARRLDGVRAVLAQRRRS